jgi:hypothetical protein
MKPSTKILLSVLILTLMALGVYGYTKKGKVTPIATGEEQVVPQKLTRESDAVTVNVLYPTIPGNGPAIAAVNVSLQNDIQKRVASFEKDAQDSMNADIGLPEDIKSSVIGSPSIEERNTRFVSIFMGMEWYLRGAAHPSHSIDTYVYDYKENRMVSVADMFKKGSDYLSVLSKLSREDLLAQSRQGDMGFTYDSTMVLEGTSPTVENFSKILPTKDGLVIYFDEYQVAPYAAGPQQVAIPYAKIADSIDKEGVLGTYVK